VAGTTLRSREQRQGAANQSISTPHQTEHREAFKRDAEGTFDKPGQRGGTAHDPRAHWAALIGYGRASSAWKSSAVEGVSNRKWSRVSRRGWRSSSNTQGAGRVISHRYRGANQKKNTWAVCGAALPARVSFSRSKNPVQKCAASYQDRRVGQTMVMYDGKCN